MANDQLKVAGVRFVVEGGEKFAKDMKEANKQFEEGSQQLQRVQAEYGRSAKSTEALSKKHEALGNKMAAQEKKVKAMRSAYAAYEKSGKATEAQLDKLRRAIEKEELAQLNLQRQYRETGAQMGIYQTRAEQMEASLTRAAGKCEAFSQKTMGLSVAAAGLATMSAKAYVDFEDSLYELATLPNVDVGQLEEFGDAMLAASDASHTAAEEISAATYQAVSAGVAAEDAVAFVELAAKAAVAGQTDVTTAVDGTTSAMNAWGIATRDSERVMSAFLATQNEGKTTFGELARGIGQVTGLAPQLGMSLEEMLAAVAALTKSGESTDSAFTGMKAVLAAVLKPTSEAAKEAKRLGLDFSAAAFQAKGFTGFMADVMEKTGGSEESLAKLFGSVEGLSRILKLGTTASDDYAQALVAIGGSSGLLEQAFGARVSSRAEKLNGAMNKLKNAAIELGGALAPMVDFVAGTLGQGAELLGNMDEGTQKMLVSAVGLTAALGPLSKGLSGLLTAGKALMGIMSGPAGWIALGVAGLTALAVAIANIPTSAERMNEALANLELEVPQESVNAVRDGINAGVAAADKTVEVTLQVNADASAMEAALTDAFSDDKLTRKEFKAITGFVNDYVDPDIKAATKTVKSSADTLRATLGSAIGEDGAPIFSQERIDELCASLETRTTGLCTELDTYRDEYNNIVSTIYREGRTPTEAEIARLDELLEKMGVVKIELATLTDTATQVAKAKVARAKRGEGSEADFGEAVGFTMTLGASNVAMIEDDYNAKIAEAQADLDALLASGDAAAEEIEWAEAEIDRLFAERDAAVFAAQRQNAEDMLSLFNGYSEAYPEASAGLKAIAGLYDEYMALQKVFYSDESTPDDWGALLTPERVQALAGENAYQYAANQGFFEAGANWDTMDEDARLAARNIADSLMQQMMQGVQERLAEPDVLAGMTENPLLGLFQGMLESGALTNLDVSGVDGAMATVLKALDLKARGSEIGAPLVEGVEVGIGTAADGMSATDAEMVALRDAVFNNAKEALEIHSPSALTQPLGADLTAGVGVGMTSPEAVATLRTSSALLGRTVQNGLASLQAYGLAAGAKAAAGLVSGMEASKQSVYAKARELALGIRDAFDEVEFVVSINLAGRPQATRTATVTPESESSTSYVANTYVNIGEAKMQSERSVRALAREISAIAEGTMKGVGVR